MNWCRISSINSMGNGLPVAEGRHPPSTPRNKRLLTDASSLLAKFLQQLRGVSKNRGGPPKWMVKIMENPIKMYDLELPLFSETP